ncbi:MAG: HDOD domain-containing protein, partial [Nitrospirales bacterium]|nr:HDOD domain-containing protein [Nitrospirales bacterium]
LGMDQIKQIALTLMLFEQLQKGGSGGEVLEAIIQAFYAGVVARRIMEDLNHTEEEEAFICALLHPLGRIIVAHAMPGKVLEISRISAEKGISDEQASASVLGISYEEIGTTIASEWNYPRKIVQSIRHMPGQEMSDNPGEAEMLGMIATVSTGIANILATGAAREEKENRVKTLLVPYNRQLPPRTWTVEGLISGSVQELGKLSSILELDIKRSSFKRQLDLWTETTETKKADSLAGDTGTDRASRIAALSTVDDLLTEEEENPEAIFSKGIRDINNSLLGPCSLNNVIHIALETIYRGMNASQVRKVLFFVRDIKADKMEIRFGFGDGVAEAKGWFSIHLAENSDVFNVAVSKDKDLVIKDTDAPEIRPLFPAKYRDNTPTPGYMLLFPISVNRKNIGLICIEGEKKAFGNISRTCLSYLKILRDQIVTATRQSVRPADNRTGS